MSANSCCSARMVFTCATDMVHHHILGGSARPAIACGMGCSAYMHHLAKRLLSRGQRKNNLHERIIDRFRNKPAISEMNTLRPPRRHRTLTSRFGWCSSCAMRARTELVNLKVCLARSHILPFGQNFRDSVARTWSLTRAIFLFSLLSVVRVRARALICQILHATACITGHNNHRVAAV